MADQLDPAIESAVEDLGYIARNLRSANQPAAADAVEQLAGSLGSSAAPASDSPVTPPAPETTTVAIVGTPSAAALAALVPDDADAERIDLRPHGAQVADALVAGLGDGYDPDLDDDQFDVFVPVTVTITFQAGLEASVEQVRSALAGALELIGGYDWVTLDIDTGVATILVTEPGDLPLAPGSVPVAGVTLVNGVPSPVTAAVPSEDGEFASIDDAFALADEALAGIAEMAALEGEALPEAPIAFSVSYTLEGGDLNDETVQPVLAAAEATLRRFGELVPADIRHEDGSTIVNYAVLEAGPVTTQHLAVRTIGWGGTLEIPGVGRVTAALV